MLFFRGVAQSRSTWLAPAAALRKAYGVGRGRGIVEHTDKGLILILEMFDIWYLRILSGTEGHV